jgi:hypothetical protein
VESTFMKEKAKGIEQEAVNMIQTHLDNVGLSAKHSLMMSWGQWGQLRRILGFQFNPPEDESYNTDGDIGEYVRLDLPSGVKLFVLPSKYLIQQQEQKIVEECGGYSKLDDGHGFEVDWKRKIVEEIELKDKAFWDAQDGAEVQVLGDAFNFFAGAKCVNTAARVVGNQTLRGHLSTMKTQSWYGREATITRRC